MKVRALSIVEPGRTAAVERELPPLGPLDLLVRVKVGGVCRGDVEVFRGDESVPTPYLGGHESAGTVVEVGSAVTYFTAGDNVAMLGDGRFSELTVVEERKAARLPAVIDDWSKWVVEPVACAVNGVDVAKVRVDDVVGVVGCGYMGQLVLRALTLTPARQLLAFDVVDQALAAAERSGATAGLRSDLPADVLDAAVEKAVFRRPMPSSYILPGLENGPMDIAFETSGTAAGLALAAKLVRVGGTLVMFGHQRGKVEIDGTQWHLKGITVVNASPMSAEDIHQMFSRTAAMLSAGRISLDGLVSHTAELDDAQRVFEASGRPGYTKGSILFNNDGTNK